MHRSFDGEAAKRRSLAKNKTNLSIEESDFLNFVQLSPLFTTLSDNGGVATPKKLNALTKSLLDNFYERHSYHPKKDDWGQIGSRYFRWHEGNFVNLYTNPVSYASTMTGNEVFTDPLTAMKTFFI